MYLEQISHHPPIVSYYLMGRGFKAYGSITTKASFGLNTIYGYSDKPNYVLFDDGTEIEVSFAKMAIKGILFGEREFNFIEKSNLVLIQSMPSTPHTESFPPYSLATRVRVSSPPTTTPLIASRAPSPKSPKNSGTPS